MINRVEQLAVLEFIEQLETTLSSQDKTTDKCQQRIGKDIAGIYSLSQECRDPIPAVTTVQPEWSDEKVLELLKTIKIPSHWLI